MIHVQYPKCGLIFGLLLLLSTILLTIAEDGSRSALAQITPAPEKFGSNDESSSNSSPNTDDDGNAGDDNNGGSTGSSSGSTDGGVIVVVIATATQLLRQAMNTMTKPQKKHPMTFQVRQMTTMDRVIPNKMMKQ